MMYLIKILTEFCKSHGYEIDQLHTCTDGKDKEGISIVLRKLGN